MSKLQEAALAYAEALKNEKAATTLARTYGTREAMVDMRRAVDARSDAELALHVEARAAALEELGEL